MSDPIKQVKKLLYRRLRVQLKDGRTVMGDFQSFDKQGNIILSSAFETIITSTGRTEERSCGMVLIPSAYQAKVDLQGTLEDRMLLSTEIV